MKVDSVSIFAIFVQLAVVSATGCEVVVTDTSGASVTQTLAENTTGDVVSSDDDVTLCMATFKCIDSTQACLVGYIDGDCASTTCNGASGGEGSGAEGEFVTTQASPGNKIVAVGKDWSGEKVIVPGKTWNGKRFIQAGEDFKGNVVDVGRGLKGERRFVKVGEDFKEVGSGKRFVRVGEDFKSDIVDVGKSFVEDKRFVKVGEDFKSDVVDVGKDWEGED